MTKQTTNNITEGFSVEMIKLLEHYNMTIHDAVAFLACLMDNKLEADIKKILATKDHRLYTIWYSDGNDNQQIALVKSDTLEKVYDYCKNQFKEEYHDEVDEFGDDMMGGYSCSIHLCEDNICDDDDCENYETTTIYFNMVDIWTEDDCTYNVMGRMMEPVNEYHDLTTQEVE